MRFKKKMNFLTNESDLLAGQWTCQFLATNCFLCIRGCILVDLTGTPGKRRGCDRARPGSRSCDLSERNTSL